MASTKFYFSQFQVTDIECNLIFFQLMKISLHNMLIRWRYESHYIGEPKYCSPCTTFDAKFPLYCSFFPRESNLCNRFIWTILLYWSEFSLSECFPTLLEHFWRPEWLGSCRRYRSAEWTELNLGLSPTLDSLSRFLRRVNSPKNSPSRLPKLHTSARGDSETKWWCWLKLRHFLMETKLNNVE